VRAAAVDVGAPGGCAGARSRFTTVIMERREPTGLRGSTFSPRDLLEFRPWMLALAVLLACAIGVGVMEQVRDARAMWAQATQDAPTRR